MTRDTQNHGWTVPTTGDDEYEITFDELFTDFDIAVEVRDEEQFLDSYNPDLNAKFYATDTGVVYIGDGSQWNKLAISPHSGTHESGGSDEIDVTGLSGTLQDPQEPIAESVEDIVGALVSGGTNVSVSYDDGANVLTIDTTALNQEEVEDAVGSLVTANNAITTTYDDAANTLTVGLDESALSFFDGTNLTADVDATTATFDDMTATEGFVTTSPSSGTDIANKDYVDSVAQGLDWQESVLAEQNDPPASPTDGDRYLVGATPTGAWDTHAGELTQYVTDTWEFYVPDEGTATFIENEDLLKVYQNGSWMPFGSAINHGSLTGLSNDDHTQYVLVDGSRAMSGTLTLSDGSTAASQNWVNTSADVPNADFADNAGDADTLDGNDASYFTTLTEVNNNADVPNADYADNAGFANNADEVDGYDVQKDGTDGSGIINFKTN